MTDAATLAAQAQRAIHASDWPAAIAALEALLPHFPAPPASILYNLGLALKKSGQFEHALARIEEALRADPSHQGAAFEQGALLIELGQWRNALAAFRRYLERFAEDEDARRNEARLLLALGDWENAQIAWARFDADEPEAVLARLSIEAETGRLTGSRAKRALVEAGQGAAIWKILSHASAGRLPLFPKSWTA
jgi:tetratricopeptide (TPR) repeat protein